MSAQDGNRAALSKLCRDYWYPIYSFLRRQGSKPPDAEDLTQGFFASLLSGGRLEKADPDRGRMRTFLLTALKNFASNERSREAALKRGGGEVAIPVDAAEAERRYAAEPAADDGGSPDVNYDRAWARSVLEASLRDLGEAYRKKGKGTLFEAIQGHLGWNEGGESYGALGARLGLSEGAVAFAVFKLRQRYREQVRRRITQTVATEADAEAEVTYLQAVFRS